MTSAANIFTFAEHTVLLELEARKDDGGSIDVNRIGLKAETISITTSRTIPSFPIPMSGVTTGESLTMAMDLGMASKTININGIITEQYITKKFKNNEFTTEESMPKPGSKNLISTKMTSFEIAQLIHSYVDSSGFQLQQNLNRLILLIPSRVGKDYQYHSSLTNETTALNTDIDDLPLIPFGFYVRDKGKKGKMDGQGVSISFGASKFPAIFGEGTCQISKTDDTLVPEHTNENACSRASNYWVVNSDVKGIRGFIRNFNTTFVGGQPWVDFTLDFEIAQIGF